MHEVRDYLLKIISDLADCVALLCVCEDNLVYNQKEETSMKKEVNYDDEKSD